MKECINTTGNIFLIGPMGAGKTSIGKVLAKKLGLDFFDTDQEIERYTGANIPWIFDIEGEPGFRLRESKVVDALTQKKGIVLATGGGVVLSEQNRECLFKRGVVVYLKANVEDQLERTARNRNRPLLQNQDPRKVFEKLKLEREALYKELADYVIETEVGSIAIIVDVIMRKIKEATKSNRTKHGC